MDTLRHKLIASSPVQIIGHAVLSVSLARDGRHSHRVLLFAVVSVVGHFTNILQENLSTANRKITAGGIGDDRVSLELSSVEEETTEKTSMAEASIFLTPPLPTSFVLFISPISGSHAVLSVTSPLESPLSFHRLSQLSMPGLVLLQIRPCVPIESEPRSRSQKSGDFSK
ncbi:hypothetical protein EYF80_001109 [Liparis tanakae]|uniref:Uncharacterized protein n=1 Tax=Liparis tanakae TaxID=230148 RepID=A0A4Z2JFL9_9TELE|nr:hypothetical protein EYF80_001109 [Liparis tanakae]